MSKEVTEKDYDKYLDEVFGTVSIAGIHYETSYALKEVDPTAYDVGFADWESEQDQDEEVDDEG